MGTSYEEVYDFFLPKIRDYIYDNLSEEELKELFEPYLITAIVGFKKCKKLLNRDAANKTFQEILTDEEKDILSRLMVVEYLSPKIITSDLLEQRVVSSEFKTWSQANHITQLKDLRDTMLSEARTKMADYVNSRILMDDFK